jgi:hypothetical protein
MARRAIESTALRVKRSANVARWSRRMDMLIRNKTISAALTPIIKASEVREYPQICNSSLRKCTDAGLGNIQYILAVEHRDDVGGRPRRPQR